MKYKMFFLFFLVIFMYFSCSTSNYTSTTNSGSNNTKSTFSTEKVDKKIGTSRDEAIKVKNIKDEYDISRKLCYKCKFSKHTLVYKDKKAYDILTYKTPEGENISYYYDISEFHFD